MFRQKWDNVIYLAARVGEILKNINFPAEFIEQNLLMNALLLKYARLCGVPNVTAILSNCIYPDVFETYPMIEEDLHKGEPQKTNFAYAIAKCSLAVQIDLYQKQNSIQSLRRIGRIIKPEINGEVLNKFVRNRQTGTPIFYGGYLAEIIKYFVENKITNSFKIASDDNLFIRQIAEIAFEVCIFYFFEISFRDFPDNSPT